MRYAHPRADSPLLDDAIRAHRKGQTRLAHDTYLQRVNEDPACLDAWMNLGSLHARAGRAAETVDAFARATGLAPNDGRVFRDIGLGLHTIGRLAEAAAALERSVTYEPELIGSWLHLARTRLESTARPLATEAAKRAVALNPADPSAWLVLARCVFENAAPEAAIEALERARTLPEASIFHRLIEWHNEGPHQSARSETLFSDSLRELVNAHPDYRELVQAAAYMHGRMARARLFSSARDTLRFAVSQAPATGHVVELGVFHGVSLRWLSECRPGNVHGFDSFVGLPSDWRRVPEGRFTTAGRIPEGIDAQFWVGPFEAQLPLFLQRHHDPIALLHVDSDLYESARCGLLHLGPSLTPGSVLVFDEYVGHRNWRQDEFRAFQEAVDANAWRYEYLAANPFTGQTVVRLLSCSDTTIGVGRRSGRAL